MADLSSESVFNFNMIFSVMGNKHITRHFSSPFIHTDNIKPSRQALGCS
ncbi:hypothetical protein QWZ16_22595 [Vibrio ostreicida]|uniref:Uncharacterized protein n=1 Tax=Vibrio ostreicida TaxID=526588 RepID=A0ABT8BZ68_9VIBR|nr:hypothetical protein [Vibrio ostreicida]MDN3612391.1 hypothetical protein [Vibrio ostreicida]